MTKSEFQRAAKVKIREAEILLNNGYFSGAYYLAGYSIECALKACIAGQVRQYELPDKSFVNKSHTHDFNTLLYLSGLKTKLNNRIEVDNQFDQNWSILNDWAVEYRYTVNMERGEAENFLNAVTDEKNGILNWIKDQW